MRRLGPMHRASSRAVAFTLACLLSTTAGAVDRRPGMLGMRVPQEPVEAPVPVQTPAPAEDRPFGPEPPPATSEDSTPPSAAESPTSAGPPPGDDALKTAPLAAPPPVVDSTPPSGSAEAIRRAEWTRDAGATAMAGGGAVTVVGVILIFAGFGASVVAVKKAGCTTSVDCVPDERKILHAGRVTLAGLVISGLGAVTLLGGIAGFLVGKNRLARARGGAFDGFGFAPSQRGVAMGLRWRI